MDKFNDIWKNRFNEGDMPSADWNTPDKEVWEGIAAELAPERKRRRWFIFLLGMLLVLLLAIGYYITVFGVNNKLSEAEIIVDSIHADKNLVSLAVDQMETENKNEKSTLEKVSNLNNNKLIGENSRAEEQQRGTETLSVDPLAPENKPARALLSKTILEDEQIVADDFNSLESGAISSETEENKLPSEGKLMQEDYQWPGQELGKDDQWKNNLPMLSTLEFYLEENTPDLSGDLKLNQTQKQKKRLPDFEFRAGALFWQQVVNDVYANDLEPFDFNYTDDIGWYTQLGIVIPVNDYFDISTGIAYERVETSSGHNSSLIYNVDAELDEKINDYAVNLATPYGAVAANFRFERIQNLNENQVDLLVDFSSGHTIQNLSVPVLGQLYPLGQKRKFVPRISAGAGANYLIGVSNDVLDINSNHSAISFTKTDRTTILKPDIQQWHFDLRLGLGLDYRITRSIRVDWSLDWARGLNPVFEENNYNTRINRYYMSLGIRKTMGL